jgi:hypothetical protein
MNLTTRNKITHQINNKEMQALKFNLNMILLKIKHKAELAKKCLWKNIWSSKDRMKDLMKCSEINKSICKHF